MRRAEGDKALATLLENAGLIKQKTDRADTTFSAGRKWRKCLSDMGFLFPDVSSAGMNQDAVGPADYVTPNGQRLIDAQSVSGEQECFLRALTGQVKTITLLGGEKYSFNPLRHILSVLRELDERTGDTSVNAIELALCLFSTIPDDGVSSIVDNLLDLRQRRGSSTSKRRFDDEEYRHSAELINSNKPHTFKDYLDANMRYLKATGIFQAKGNGLTLVQEKKAVAYAIVDFPHPDWDTEEALSAQCKGVGLPTDDIATSTLLLREEIRSLTQQFQVDYDAQDINYQDIREVEQARYEVEELLGKAKEEQYALLQSVQWMEISAYLKLFASKRYRAELSEDVIIQIPRPEAAAYLEWVVWRAFLAMDSINNKPYEIRRFNVDQDFLPLSTAPGRGSDLVVELDECIIAVEVTLTESSRQEAAEGEPVRRHVADLSTNHPDKPVIGLFIANNIDSNTAETFRIGSWYDSEDNKSKLTIVPLTTGSFCKLFSAIFQSGVRCPEPLLRVLKSCDEVKQQHEAPEWKRTIASIVDSEVSELLSA